MWTLVSPLIDETSREKFLFYGGNDYQDPGGLVDYMSPEFIPQWLGGQARTDIPEGGIVPKSHYMPVEEFEKDQSPGPHFLEESFYHSTSLSKGQVHEGIISITERGTVITWDFDVLRHDVVFTVYRLREQLPAIRSPGPTPTQKDGNFSFPAKQQTAASTGGSTVVGAFTSGPSAAPAAAASSSDKAGSSSSGAGGGSNTVIKPDVTADHKTCIDRSWKESVDYFKVENSIVCHDGESIQGTHVTSHTGKYILQWKFFDKHHPLTSASSSQHHSVSPLDVIADSLSGTQHKAKVMYYFETLNSTDYRGSMTSLQSCTSGFSTISKVSAGKQSNSGVSSSGVSSALSEKMNS